MKIGIPSKGKTDKEMPSCPILGIKESPNAMTGITCVGSHVIIDIIDTDKHSIARKIVTHFLDYAFPEETQKRNKIIDDLYNEMVIRFSDVSDQLTGEPLEDGENLRKLAQMIYFAINGED